MGWARSAWIAITLLAFAAGNATATEPKRVLLLHSFGWNFKAEDVFGDYLRTDLAEKSPYPLDAYEAVLEIARFNDGERDEAFVSYLRALFATRPPDLIVTMVSPAARFIQRHRQDLFPSTPVIFGALDARAIRDGTLTANDTTVAVSTDQRATIENILQTLPGTTTVAVVTGDAPIERFWVKELRLVIQPFENRINFVFLNELSFGDMLTRVAALPPRSAIYFGDLVVDAQGIPHRQEEVLSRLHAVANAPIFGQYDYQLGGGIVGGPLLSVHTLSRKTAEVAAQILGGASPGDIKTPPQKLAGPEFDWRELRRWGIQQVDLPSGSTISFREPTLWERYRWYILAVAGFSGLQGILIVGLLLNRLRLRRAQDRLRRAEDEARDLNGRLITAHEDERARLAHALHDDVTQRLALLAIDAGRTERGLGDTVAGQAMRSIRHDLVQLSKDVHALSYALHPAILEDLGLIEALKAECARFSAVEGIPTSFSAADNVDELTQALSLCLFRVAQEALRNVARHSNASSVEVELRTVGNELELAVRDNGVGFDPGRKQARPSLGLAGMRQRLSLIEGELLIDSAPGGGASIVARAPWKREGAAMSSRS
jgi:signal transduction histidine kinase